MSLSRPARFPLLKLPWLCIKCVIQNSDLFDVIFFATISNKTRRIVKSSNYPLREFDVAPNDSKIYMGNGKTWYFFHDKNAYGIKLLQKKNFQALRISARSVPNTSRSYLHTYTNGDTLDAMKMGINFMIDMFGCTIRELYLERMKLAKLVKLGTMSVKTLIIGGGPVYKNNLKYVLENIEVTDKWVFRARIPANFSWDPQSFKCRRLAFLYSADWVTLELLCQFDVPQLYFYFHHFSVEDIVSYVTHWFNSVNRKLEYLHVVHFSNPVSLENFKIDHLNPMPFCEKRRNRCAFVGGWKDTDISSGMDILREDGLLATFYVDSTSVVFYVWHNRFPDGA